MCCILRKRHKFNRVRANLKSKGTKFVKRVLKYLNQQENCWMSDINQRTSKTLIDREFLSKQAPPAMRVDSKKVIQKPAIRFRM